MSDDLYLKLKGAREKLCVAQSLLPELRRREYSALLGDAIRGIDRVGIYHCPQWSRFDEPHVEDPS